MKRNMRLTSIFIVIIILFTSISISVYADETEDAIKLQTIGILKGSGNGVDEAYRSSEPMRYQAAWLFLRLLGKEAEAKTWTGTLNFADSATAKTSTGSTLNSENKTMLAYLYAHQNLGFKGFTDDTFRPFEKINAQQYYKLMLVALGYEENTDFTWDSVFKSAARFGLSTEVENNNIGFNIDKLANITIAALNANLKSTERTLIAKLIEDDKSIDATKAAQAGLYGDIVVPETEEPTTNPGSGILSSIEIGELADAVVLISAVGYDGSKWNGSGFYTSLDGNLVTNYHVIEGAKTLTITENDGQVYSGNITIMGYDENEDIAALDIDRTAKLYLKTGNSDYLKVGEQIFAIGSPYGLKNTLSEGLISAIRENGDIQITAAISHGSSGGVLLNNKGEAVGITYAAIVEGENLGFAVPINKYLIMDKGLQLSLESFYYQVNAVQTPTNVYVTQIDSYSVNIKWSQVIGADYYRVYSSTEIAGTYIMLKDANGNGNWSWNNGVGVTYNKLTQGINYYIKVTAVKGSIESTRTDATSFSLAITSQIQPPSNVYLTQVDSQSYDIDWSSVAGADYYCVYESTSLNGYYSKLSSNYNNGQWDIRGVSCTGRTPGVTYYIKVTAVKNGIESAPSNVVSTTLVVSNMYRNSSTLTYTAVTGYSCLWSYDGSKGIDVDWYDSDARMFGYYYTASGYATYHAYLLGIGYTLYSQNIAGPKYEQSYRNYTTGEYIVVTAYFDINEVWVWIDE